MGKAEKINPNSAWFKKHHPELQEISHKETIIPVADKPHSNRLVGFINKVFGQPKSTKGNLSPKEN